MNDTGEVNPPYIVPSLSLKSTIQVYLPFIEQLNININ